MARIDSENVMQTCQVCGNEFGLDTLSCPFCQTRCDTPARRPTGALHREVNLKKGMPLVQQALERLENEVRLSAALGCRVLTLIHGYGSSGAGGAIREAVRQQLCFWQRQGRVRASIPGEQFEGRSRRGRQLLRRFPFLAGHHDLGRANPGITVVLL